MPVLPACAGMILAKDRTRHARRRAPRMCGDDPGDEVVYVEEKLVLPACAGMIPEHEFLRSAIFSAPRMRGDDPTYLTMQSANAACSPHARG